MIEDAKDPRRASRGYHHSNQRAGAGSAAAAPDGLLGVRQIAVVVDESDDSEQRLALACHLAVCLDAALLGIGIVPPMQAPEGVRPPITVLEQRFREAAATSSLSGTDWCAIAHAGIDELVACAKVSDLTMLGTASGPGGIPVEEVVRECGRPCLLVPPGKTFVHVGQAVAVAWDGSREAVRALGDALPVLRDAGSILVLQVGKPGGPDGAGLPDADRAVSYLARHGIQAFAEFVDVGGRSMSDALASRIAGSEIDLVVAGAFHRSTAFARWIGGAGRDLLDQVAVPMLVSH